MTRLDQNAQTPALVKAAVALERGASSDCTFLGRERRISSNQSTASELKIGTAVVLLTGDEEKILFKTNVGFNSTGCVQTEVLETRRFPCLSTAAWRGASR
jgi:hypothetical protein